ncbi:MAG: nucleotide sugar dehydrogenase [Actinobacteria bacterium]|nr:nucleotide sugar dehydrogenase [Actinomycetota bacterium]
MKKICVMGLGYIGLPTASLLANNGYEVLGVDKNARVIDKLNAGNPHIEEPDLKGIFISALNEGRLKVSGKAQKSDIFIISVPTPLGDDNKADLSYVEAASAEISRYISRGNLVILESTSPMDTTEKLVGGIIHENSGLKAGKDYLLSFCPERVLPGKIIFELVNNNRIIGGIDRESAEEAREVYSSFVKGEMFLTDLRTAELVKLVENTYRDVNLAFANELSLICADYDINVRDVIKYANMHPRVNILNPGPGVGGHCIPIDPWFILQSVSRKNTLIERSRRINDDMPLVVSGRIFDLIRKNKNPKATILGASYKENVGDHRESPTKAVVSDLLAKKVRVSVYDPLVDDFINREESLEASLKSSDIMVLMVGHNVFRDIDFKKACKLMRNKTVFDTRNFYDGEELASRGFKYYRL